MEWNKNHQKFVSQRPAPPPMIDVQIGVISLSGEIAKTVNAKTRSCADSGCQTCTAGSDILKRLDVKTNELLNTKHNILGITDSSLNVIGALTVEIKFRGAISRQLLYIASNIQGVYLSETALKDLGVLPQDFPNGSPSQTAAASVPVDNNDEGKCKCLPREGAPERPSCMPIPPTRENRGKLKQWLIDAFSNSAFNTCSHQTLNVMTGKPMDIVFEENATPYAVHVPIPIPRHWKERVKEEIDRDVRLGIIEPVPQGTPVEWCARMVVTPKKDGAPRRTIDLQHLKSATRRETHFTQTPFSIVSSTPKNVLKTVLDAWNGYHSLKLTDGARDATTFITEWGRYRYCRAPMGFHASGDAYTKRFDDITQGVQRVRRCVDDSLLTDASIEDAFFHTFDYLKLCSDNGIVFNEKKFVFAEEEVEFAGFLITMDGYRPPVKITDAIKKFPSPESLTDIRAWFGLVNQVNYSLAQCDMMAPFRELLSKKNKFYWDETLERLFEESKDRIIALIHEGVKTFEMDRVTCLTTDWSKNGLGFTLSQKHCSCPKPNDSTWNPLCGKGHWKLVQAGSRFTTPAESRYSPPEGEALAVVYGLQQCRTFVMGSKNLVIAVDHKPLTRIFNDRPLETIENPRLLRLKEKTMMYDFEITHIPGKMNNAADAASRYPARASLITFQHAVLGEAERVTSDADDDPSRAFAIIQSSGLPASVSWEEVNDEAKTDTESVALKEAIQSGFPNHRDSLPETIRYFWTMKDDLYVIDDVVFKGRKMLIPQKLRNRVLEGLHASHQGTSSMALNARERLFWPNLHADLKTLRDRCKQCNKNAPSQRDEEPITTTSMEYPFQQVVTDLCASGGHTYIVYADRLSGWTEVERLQKSNLAQVKKCLLRWFSTYGVPEEIASDGGPPYNAAEYDNFLKAWTIRKRLSSAYYPQSNGRAEAAVKVIKRILLDNVDPQSGSINTDRLSRALLNHRNTPREQTELSPSEILYGKKLRDHLPTKIVGLKKEWVIARQAKEIQSLKMKHPSKLEKRSCELVPLEIGDSVIIQNQSGARPKQWDRTGIVADVNKHRQYKILVDGSRRVTLRNRKFVKKILPSIRTPSSMPYPSPQESMNEQHGQLADVQYHPSPVNSPTTRQPEGNATPEILQSPINVEPVRAIDNNVRVDLTPDRRVSFAPEPTVFAGDAPRRSARSTKGKAPEKLNL